MTTHRHSTQDGSSMRRYLVMAALTSSLVACAAAAPAPKDSGYAMGPNGPGPENGTSAATALPPDHPPPPPPDKGGMGYRENPDELDDELVLGTVPNVQLAPAAPPPPQKPILAARGAAKAPMPAGDAALSDPLASRGDAEMASTAGKEGKIGAANEVRGSIDKAEIQRVIRSHLSEVKQCYDQGLARQSDLEGRVAIKITISKTGSVTSATKQDSTLPDRLVEQCIQKAVQGWTFPKPTGDGNVTIVYPFILKTTE